MSEDENLFITIDTNIFFHSGFDFKGGLLASLMQFSGLKSFVMSEVVLREAKRYFIDKATEHKSSILRSLQKPLFRPWSSVATYEDFTKSLSDLDDVKWAADSFDNFVEACGVEVIECERANLAELMDLYFSSAAPFSLTGKKCEFPDAVALLGLRNFAKSHSSRIIVVSNDGDWKEFCDRSDGVLIFTDSLSDGLAQFNQHVSEKSTALISKVFSYLQSGAASYSISQDLAPRIRYMVPTINYSSNRPVRHVSSDLSVVPGTAKIDAVEEGGEENVKIIKSSVDQVVLVSPLVGRVGYWILFDRSTAEEPRPNDMIEVRGSVEYSCEVIIYISFQDGEILSVHAELSGDRVQINVGDLSQYEN